MTDDAVLTDRRRDWCDEASVAVASMQKISLEAKLNVEQKNHLLRGGFHHRRGNALRRSVIRLG